MSTKEKVLKIFLVLVVLVGLSFAPLLMVGGQKANVSSFWGPDNVNETVLAAQIKLKELGLYDGHQSGLFGLRTRFAIYLFQESVGLSQTGILDISTQNALFAVIPELEYIPVNYTEEGNIFLRDWIHYNYAQEGKPIEIRGELTLGNEDAFYQDYSDPTRFVLVTEDGEYSILNISNNNLHTFVGQRVSLSGFHLGYENNIGLRTIVINYVHEGEPTPSVFINYTEDGNYYLKKLIRKSYQESGEYVNMSGILTQGDEIALYEPNGYRTQVILTSSDGQQYSVENISANNLDEFLGQYVQLRGLLLEHDNNLGLLTIAINYILSDVTVNTTTLGTGF